MINFGFISLDIIILIFIIGILLFFSFKYGKKLTFSLILATYPSIYILKFLPYIELKTQTAYTVAFLLIYILFFFVFWKILYPRNASGKFKKTFEFLILSFSFILLLTAVSNVELSSLSSFINFSGFINKIVASIPYGLSLIIPIIVIFFTTQKNNY
jgi:hypothetical protein